MSMNPRRTHDRPGRLNPWVGALALLLPFCWTLAATACEYPRKPTVAVKPKKKHKPTTSTTTKPPVVVVPKPPTTPLPEKVTDTPPKPPITTVTPSTPTTPPSVVTPTPVAPSPEHVSPIPEPSTALIGLGLVGAVAVAMRSRRRSMC